MQNRYVADIGDYVKFAILRALAFDRNLGLVWWLFPDENHNRDGGHREYLNRPKEWKAFDPDLFEALLTIDKKKERGVQAVEHAAILPNALFISDYVPCRELPFSSRPVNRSNWLAHIKSKLAGCDVVFLDPDNGIASERMKLTRRCAGKSVIIEEIKMLQESGRTLVVYHHQTHLKGGHSSEICHLAARLEANGIRFSGALRAKPMVSSCLFHHQCRDRAKGIAKLWKGWMSWHTDTEILRSSGGLLRSEAGAHQQ